MGNACNFAQDDQEMHFENQNRYEVGGNKQARTDSFSVRGDGQSSLIPQRNPLRLEEIE